MKGSIKRVFLPRGFAFILGDDGIDYFLNANDLRGTTWSGETIFQGVRVEFNAVANGENGMKAVDATMVKL